jgi:hypothetical protein
MHLISILIFIKTAYSLSESDYPLAVETQFDAGLTGALVRGWNLQGKVVYEQAWIGADKTLKFELNLDRPKTNWVNQGFYQMYVQIQESGFP